MATSVALTTADNNLTVKCNETTVKQIWINETKVYQKWKDAKKYGQQMGMAAQARLAANSRKYWSTYNSYVKYSFTVTASKVSSTVNNGAYFRLMYYDPDGVRQLSKDYTTADTFNFSQTINYTTVYGPHNGGSTDYDTMNYAGVLIVISSAHNGSGGTKAVQNTLTAVTPPVTSGYDDRDTNYSPLLYKECYIGTSQDIRVEDN